VLAEQAAQILSERARVADALRRVAGYEVFPTETNFVLLRVADANATFAALRAAGILVKNLHGWHPLLAQCLRVTIGTPAENDAVLRVLALSP
jgi:histidinol-phosphate aminotransferase